MSNDTITYVIAGTAAGISVIAWAVGDQVLASR